MNLRITALLIILHFCFICAYAQSNYAISLYGGSFNEGIGTFHNTSYFEISNTYGTVLGGGIYQQPSERFDLYGTVEYLRNHMIIEIKDCNCYNTFISGNPYSFNFGVNYKPWIINKQSYLSLGIGYSLLHDFKKGGTYTGWESDPVYDYYYLITVSYPGTFNGILYINGSFDYPISKFIRAFVSARLSTELHAGAFTNIGVDYESSDKSIVFRESAIFNLNNMYLTIGIKYNLFDNSSTDDH